MATLKEQIDEIERRANGSAQADLVLVRALSKAYFVLSVSLLETLRRCGECRPDRFCSSCVVVYRRLREMNDAVNAAIRGEGGEP